MADVNKKTDIGGTDAQGEAADAKSDTAADEGIVIVDVETLLADKIPDISSDDDGDTPDDADADKSHSAFADALEDALGTSYEGGASSVDDDAPDPLDEILRETELDNASAILQSGPASAGGAAGVNSGSGTMGSSNPDDDPSVVFGIFPPSYSNMPGGQPGQSGKGATGAGASGGRHTLGGDDDDGWDNRALITSADKAPAAKSGRSALAAGALGLLGGLAIVGGAATYAVKNDMVSLRGFTPDTETQTATTRAKTPEVLTPGAGQGADKAVTQFAATASVAVTDVSGFARNSIPLSLTPQNTGSNSNYYVRVKGVPPGARLSGGLNEGGGTWLLRPSGLKDVALKVPSYFTGNFTLGAQLVSEDGKTPINAVKQFQVEIKTEAVAGGKGNVEEQAAKVVNQIVTADRPKVAAFQPPADDLDNAPLAQTGRQGGTQEVDKLASLLGGTASDDDVEEEGLGALPTDFGDNPDFLKQSGIRPPLRATRAPRRSLLENGSGAAGRVPAAGATAYQDPPIRAANTRSSGIAGFATGAESRGLESAAVVASVNPGQAGPAASGSGADDAEMKRLIRRGDRFYKLGDLASARLFYMRAYESGSALGAMSVGRTYDPVYFKKLGVRGFQSNPQKALEWYQKAVAGGLALARTKMADLNTWLGR